MNNFFSSLLGSLLGTARGSTSSSTTTVSSHAQEPQPQLPSSASTAQVAQAEQGNKEEAEEEITDLQNEKYYTYESFIEELLELENGTAEKTIFQQREIVVEIFRYFDIYDLFVNCYSVSKLWRFIILLFFIPRELDINSNLLDLINSKNQSATLGPPFVKNLLQLTTNLKRLKIYNISTAGCNFVGSVARKAQEAKQKQVISIEQVLDDKVVYKIMRQNGALESVELNGFENLSRKTLKLFKELKQIHIVRCWNFEDSMVPLFAQFTNLQKLKLSQCKSLSPQAYSHLRQLTNLVSLDLSASSNLYHLDFLLSMPHLKELYLRDCRRISYDLMYYTCFIYNGKSKLPDLEVLDLSGCVLVQNFLRRYYDEMNAKGPYAWKDIFDEEDRALVHQYETKLKKLTKNIEFFECLATSFPGLKTLILRDNRRLCISESLHKLSHLQDLQLDSICKEHFFENGTVTTADVCQKISKEISQLVQLKRLDLTGLYEKGSIIQFIEWSKLTELEVFKMWWSRVTDAEWLQSQFMSGCISVHLKELNIKGHSLSTAVLCSFFTKYYEHLSKFFSREQDYPLSSLNISGNRSMSSIEPLLDIICKNHPKMQTLNVTDCGFPYINFAVRYPHLSKVYQ